MVFGKGSVPGCALGVASRSGGGVIERDSLKSRDFLIIFRRENLSSSCLAWIAAMAVITADVIALIIDYCRQESMT